jgi:hypothetical protein
LLIPSESGTGWQSVKDEFRGAYLQTKGPKIKVLHIYKIILKEAKN